MGGALIVHGGGNTTTKFRGCWKRIEERAQRERWGVRLALRLLVATATLSTARIDGLLAITRKNLLPPGVPFLNVHQFGP